MSIPEWIYFAMGAAIARILLDGTQTQGYRPMDWFRLVFQIARIVILWPLVLFVEKIEEWLKRKPAAAQTTKDETAGMEISESLPLENAAPVSAAGVNKGGGRL